MKNTKCDLVPLPIKLGDTIGCVAKFEKLGSSVLGSRVPWESFDNNFDRSIYNRVDHEVSDIVGFRAVNYTA